MYGKFMNKKFFHPGSFPNIRRKWMAEQKAAAKEQKQQEMKEQHAKEQENYQNKVLLAKSDSDRKKLDLNFMYDLPPGMLKDKKDDSGEEETVKFEWQKGAPKESYTTKLGLDVHDQPFGICVRNVKCFKCGKWGHQNTDRECSMFGENRKDSELESLRLSDPLRLIEDMKEEHGITLKKSVIGREINPMDHNHQILESDDEVDPDVQYIQSLTDKEKKKLLKRLNKFENKDISLKSRKRKRSDYDKTSNSIIINNAKSNSLHDCKYNKLPKLHKHKKKKKHKKLRKHDSNKTNDSENEWTSNDSGNEMTRSNSKTNKKHKAKYKEAYS